MKKKYIHSTNFISNLEKRDRYNLLAAAKKTGTRIYFEDKAYDGNGLPLKDMVGVFSSDVTQDYGDMWLEYNYAASQSKKLRRVKK
jgi:hypothetical protein